jgi:putative chitinase
MIFKYKILSIYFIFIRKVCLGLPLFLLGACVQEADAPVGTVTQPEKTDPVRTWFEANKEVLISRGQKGSESLRTGDKFLFPYIEKEIDWSQSLTFKFKDGREVLEFPVKSEQIPIPGFLVDSVGDKSKIKIKQSALFVKKQGGNDYSPVLVRFYTLGGDLDKVSYNQLPKGWNGVIEAFGMNDGYYITFTFKEGKMVSYSKIGADVTKNSNLRHENKRTNCYTILVENPSYVLCVESIDNCTIYSGGTTPITYCIPDASFDPSDSEAGGDGSGGDGFCEGFDCYSFPGGDFQGEEEEEDPCKTSKKDLKNAFPDAPDSFLGELEMFINKHANDFGIDTKEKMNHFLAQAAHESTNYLGNSFSALEENLNYRLGTLGTNNFGAYFNPISNPTSDPLKANPNDFKRSESSIYADPEKLANYVYARKQLGNTSPGDGYKYRGRGIFQLTGKYNYEQFNNFYNEKFNANIDLIKNPEMVSNNIELAVISALWYFENKVLKEIDVNKDTNIKKVTQLVNGGENGLPHRREVFNNVNQFINCL